MGGTPWHAHHIAERNGLLTIIALGEGVVGTVASLSAVVAEQGWSTDAVLVAVAGTGLTFGMWWVYFVVPAADLLHAHRDRSIGYGYLHIAVFGSIVATGAGLHAAADFIEHRSALSSVATVVAVALPVGVYVGAVFGTYLLLTRAWDGFYGAVVLMTLAVLGSAVGLASAGVSTPLVPAGRDGGAGRGRLRFRVPRPSAHRGRAGQKHREQPTIDRDTVTSALPAGWRRASISTTICTPQFGQWA